MRFHFHSDKAGPPCSFMERYLQKMADGTAGPMARWYALAHALRCTRCMKYLRAMEALIQGLRRGKAVQPEPDTMARLTDAVHLAAAQIRA